MWWISAGRNGAGSPTHDRDQTRNRHSDHADRPATGMAGAASGGWRHRAPGSGTDAGLSRQARAERAFCRKRVGDARLLLLRADVVLRDRARDRRVDGNPSSVRGGRRADPHLALHAAEGDALPSGAADLRAQPIGPGDIRCNARGAAGRAFDHDCDPQYSTGLFEVGTNASAIEMADHSHGAFSSHASRGDRGAPNRLLSDAARGASGGDVRGQAWTRLSDNQRHAADAGRGDGYDCSSSLLKKVFEVSLWATLIQDPSARR